MRTLLFGVPYAIPPSGRFTSTSSGDYICPCISLDRIVVKTLRKDLFMKFNGKFTKNNTIIIDDNLVKHILNNSENVLFLVSWSHDGASQNDTFLIDKLLPWLQKLHGTQDIGVATRVLDQIDQPMLSNDPSSKEYYVKIKEGVDNAHKFSYS